MSDWKEITPGNSWNYKEAFEEAKQPKAGVEFVGTFLDKEEHVGENDSTVYNFETPDGDFMNVWGSTLLDLRLKNVKPGEEVKIIYLGAEASEKRKGKSYHNFRVFHRKPEFQEVENQEVKTDDIPW
jgi:hypothetical protein